MESSDHQAAAASENPSDHDGEDQQGASHVTSRSYECNFCKRGFSNAQALGGHMNIHRKDKAKLKQQQSSNQIQQSGEEISNKSLPKWNWNVSSQQEHANIQKRQQQQLPLFAESPNSSETQNQPQGHETTTEQPLLSSTQDSSSELDLELRLGLIEPQDSSAAETGTRNFF